MPEFPTSTVEIEGLLPAWLDTTLGIDGLTYTETPRDLEKRAQTVQLVRAGGPSSFTLERPRIVAHSFAPTRIAARNLAGQVNHAFAWLLKGAILGDVLVVSKVDVNSGPSWVPDPNTSLRHFQATYNVTARRISG